MSNVTLKIINMRILNIVFHAAIGEMQRDRWRGKLQTPIIQFDGHRFMLLLGERMKFH